jgi:hypothetical protein
LLFTLSGTPGLRKMPFFLLHMLLMNELANDLRPEISGVLSARPLRSSAEGRVFSIATVAPRPAPDHSDKLFRDLWRWTQDGSRVAAALPHAPALALDDITLRLPSQRAIVLPKISETDNDGVVTTERQVLGELTGVVVGDHVDVIGRYRRASLIDGKVIDPGLLTSGAQFGDDEFFGLISRIGERIAQVANAEE